MAARRAVSFRARASCFSPRHDAFDEMRYHGRLLPADRRSGALHAPFQCAPYFARHSRPTPIYRAELRRRRRRSPRPFIPPHRARSSRHGCVGFLSMRRGARGDFKIECMIDYATIIARHGHHDVRISDFARSFALPQAAMPPA